MLVMDLFDRVFQGMNNLKVAYMRKDGILQRTVKEFETYYKLFLNNDNFVCYQG